ncbi:transposable element Tc1 transposase [Trichonephila clavipes]|nr:transposable element Tc1 transposase [Trichonephila clavipes]
MPRRRIRAQYEQLSEFERDRIIELKEGGWTNRRITRHMNRSDAAIRRCWQEWVDSDIFQCHDVFSDEFSFQLCPDKHGKRVWRHPGQCDNLAFTVRRHTGPQQGVMDSGDISFEAGPFWTLLEAHLQHIAYQTLPCPAKSPDPSPIEHVWDMMGRRLHQPGNVDDLA